MSSPQGVLMIVPENLTCDWPEVLSQEGLVCTVQETENGIGGVIYVSGTAARGCFAVSISTQLGRSPNSASRLAGKNIMLITYSARLRGTELAGSECLLAEATATIERYGGKLVARE